MFSKQPTVLLGSKGLVVTLGKRAQATRTATSTLVTLLKASEEVDAAVTCTATARSMKEHGKTT